MTFLQLLLRGLTLAAVAVLATGGWLVADWIVREQQLRALFPAGGYLHNPAALWIGGVLIACALLGRLPMRLLLGKPHQEDLYVRCNGWKLETPDGAKLWVESHGEEHAPAIILTHGWGLDSTVWRDAKAHLSGRFHVIVWDLPGHGRSTAPTDGDVGPDRMADHLKAVLELAQGPAVLVGHAAGGMVVQAFCRRHAALAEAKVAGIVLENTTHTDPTRTTYGARLLGLLEAPVLRPLLHLEIALWPLARLAKAVGWLSGMTHLGMRLGAFGNHPSRLLLDLVSRLAARGDPRVRARGMLAMMRWDMGVELLRIRQPAHVFIGEQDLAFRPAAGRTIASAILGAFETRVPHAGMLGPIECPSYYDHAVAAFADSVLTKGATWADQPVALASLAPLARRPRKPRTEARSFDPAEERRSL